MQAFSAASQALLIYSATDRNGNNVADANELEQLQNFAGVDPANPGAGVNFNRVDPDLTAPKTHEVVFGLDRELMPKFGVSASLSWRRFNDVIWSGYDPSQQITVYPLVGVTRADYQLEGVVEGNVPGVGAYRQEYYAPTDASLPPGNGSEYRNRPDYHQQYLGFEVQAIKRLSNRWMARVGFSSNRHTEQFGERRRAAGSGRVHDVAEHRWRRVRGRHGGERQERDLPDPAALPAVGVGPVSVRSRHQRGGQPHRCARDTACRSSSRSSRPIRCCPRSACCSSIRVRAGCPPSRCSICAAKSRSRSASRQLALSLDLFNVFNSATVLGRQYDVTTTGTTGFNQPLEIMNPRLLRFGVRFQF